MPWLDAIGNDVIQVLSASAMIQLDLAGRVVRHRIVHALLKLSSFSSAYCLNALLTIVSLRGLRRLIFLGDFFLPKQFDRIYLQ